MAVGGGAGGAGAGGGSWFSEHLGHIAGAVVAIALVIGVSWWGYSAAEDSRKAEAAAATQAQAAAAAQAAEVAKVAAEKRAEERRDKAFEAEADYRVAVAKYLLVRQRYDAENDKGKVKMEGEMLAAYRDVSRTFADMAKYRGIESALPAKPTTPSLTDLPEMPAFPKPEFDQAPKTSAFAPPPAPPAPAPSSFRPADGTTCCSF